MPALSQKPLPYVPSLAPPRSSAIELGRAFARAWHERSDLAERALRDATAELVMRLKDDRLPMEEAVVAFKTAIRRHGGVHSFPSLVAEEHSIDGEECAVTYERAFAWFIDAYFSAP